MRMREKIDVTTDALEAIESLCDDTWSGVEPGSDFESFVEEIKGLSSGALEVTGEDEQIG